MESTARVLFAMSIVEVMSEQERDDFMNLYRDRYCTDWGREDASCQCMNDE